MSVVWSVCSCGSIYGIDDGIWSGDAAPSQDGGSFVVGNGEHIPGSHETYVQVRWHPLW